MYDNELEGQPEATSATVGKTPEAEQVANRPAEVTPGPTLESSPEATANSSFESGEEKGFFDLLYGVIARPVETLRYIADHRLIFVSIVLSISIAWISSIANIPGMLNDLSQAPSGLGSLPAMSAIRGFFLVFAIVIPPFSAMLTLVMQAGILHILAILFKGKGSYDGLIGALGFASFPSVILIPFALIELLVNRTGSQAYATAMIPVSLGVSLGFLVWIFILDVIGVRENYSLTTWRAFLVVAIPIATFIILIVSFIVVIGIFVAGTLSSINLP